MYRDITSSYEEYLKLTYGDETTCELLNDLEKIEKQRKQLDLEELFIMKELWERVPSLKKNELFQPKMKVKEKKNGK